MGALPLPITASTPTRSPVVPTVAPLPTEALPPTEAPLSPVPRPTEPPPPTEIPVTRSPSSSPVASSETTKTYERTELGFSIEYPDNWTIEREQPNSVTFLHPSQQLRTFLLVNQNTSWTSGAAYNAGFVKLLENTGTVKDLSTTELAFSDATWAVTVFNLEKTTEISREFLASTIRNGDLYVILNYGDIDVFLGETQAMSRMNASLRFLTEVRPTESALTRTYRATVAVEASGGQPFIRGRVLDHNGRAVSGAIVELYNADKHYLIGTGTGTDGRYELTVSAGAYYIKIKNFTSDWSPLVTVKWGQEATVDWKEQ